MCHRRRDWPPLQFNDIDMKIHRNRTSMTYCNYDGNRKASQLPTLSNTMPPSIYIDQLPVVLTCFMVVPFDVFLGFASEILTRCCTVNGHFSVCSSRRRRDGKGLTRRSLDDARSSYTRIPRIPGRTHSLLTPPCVVILLHWVSLISSSKLPALLQGVYRDCVPSYLVKNHAT